MKISSFVGPFLLVTLLAACSSSDEPEASDPTGAGGSAAGASAGGGSGASGAGTGGATAGAGGSTAGAGGSTAGAGGSTAGAGGSTAGAGGSTAGAGGSTAGAGGSTAGAGGSAAGAGGSAAGAGGSAAGAGGSAAGAGGSLPVCGMPDGCAVAWEQAASDKYDSVLGKPADLATFLHDVPKGGDLHNHLSGAVYAETVLGWAKADGNCINPTTFGTVAASQCATNQPVPTSGTFFDDIVRAWSMKDFVAGAETGHDHFFATFGKFGSVAGLHRDDSIADVAKRAADENMLYVETMFNMGKNVGQLTTDIWSGTLTEAALSGLYDKVIADPKFAGELAKDVAVVNDAATKYRTTLGCSGATPPPACSVGVRFIAQVSRTGAKDLVFGQLISAFEMAAKTDKIVAANLSSPEDDTTSINNYTLHMAMLDFLYAKYTATQKSPLHITLHAGELSPKYLPPGSTANTFHIRQAVEKGHAERIGHGLDVLSETDSTGLLAEMAQKKVMVEVCLSSNVQILEISGTAHPLGTYLKSNVPVALGTDDQGVSRSSMAGEYLRAAQDQQLNYRQLKAMARSSLEHAFLPGASVWSSVDTADAVAECATTKQLGLGGTPTPACKAFLDGSERARMQWELERRFQVFESKQLSPTARRLRARGPIGRAGERALTRRSARSSG